jgi:hypothetical protein
LTAVLGVPVVPVRPRVHHAEVEVGNTALPDGGLPAGIVLNGELALVELVKHNGRLDARNVAPADHACPAE